MKLLSTKLKDNINLDFYGKILYEMKLFRFNFSDELLTSISLQMEEKLFGPGELIYSQDEFDGKIYFIIKGKVELFINKKYITRNTDEDNSFYIFDRRKVQFLYYIYINIIIIFYFLYNKLKL